MDPFNQMLDSIKPEYPQRGGDRRGSAFGATDNQSALLNYLRFKAGIEAAGTAGAFATGFFDTGDNKRKRMLRQLEIIEKKRSLGLPTSDADYEHTVNKEKPFENPGDSITLATSLFRHKDSPIFDLGSIAGLATRGKNVSRISKYFGL